MTSIKILRSQYVSLYKATTLLNPYRTLWCEMIWDVDQLQVQYLLQELEYVLLIVVLLSYPCTGTLLFSFSIQCCASWDFQEFSSIYLKVGYTPVTGFHQDKQKQTSEIQKNIPLPLVHVTKGRELDFQKQKSIALLLDSIKLYLPKMQQRQRSITSSFEICHASSDIEYLELIFGSDLYYQAAVLVLQLSRDQMLYTTFFQIEVIRKEKCSTCRHLVKPPIKMYILCTLSE